MRDDGAPPLIHVLRTGPLVHVQDLGRAGWAHLGVSRSGAADLSALRRANRLVGNAEVAAGLEVLIGGLHVRASAHVVVAVCGASCPLLLDGRPVPTNAVLDVPPGGELTLAAATCGLRAYLAVRGGIDVAPVLGSRSRDTLADLGSAPVHPGAVLPVGVARSPLVTGWPTVDLAPVAALPAPDELVVLPALPGPRANWLDAAAAATLWSAAWEVSADSDRVGLRLNGPALRRAQAFRDVELPSEGLVRGAVQVPASGQPVLFLADHPVTGGYPVVAVVKDAWVDLAAQLRPGQRFRLAGGPRRTVVADRRADLRTDRFGPDLDCTWWGW